MVIYNSILDTIGHTPIIKLNRIGKDVIHDFYVKFDAFNPGSSVKDRIALAMIEKAETKGLITKNTKIVEATSGNTGIGLALVCAAKGYEITLIMPESMSIERRKTLKAFGANLILTEASKGMNGAIEKARELVNNNKHVFIPQQFKNQTNPEIHSKTTAMEIWKDIGSELDVFVAGIGTGGTISGVGKRLQQLKESIYIVGVEPEKSPVLSGGKSGPHEIQGIGAGFIPKVLDVDILDEVIRVTSEEAYQNSRELAKKEGIFAGISSGAAIAAAIKYAEVVNQKKKILIFLPDTGERYLSTELWREKNG